MQWSKRVDNMLFPLDNDDEERYHEPLVEKSNEIIEEHERRLREIEALLRAMFPGKFPIKKERN